MSKYYHGTSYSNLLKIIEDGKSNLYSLGLPNNSF